MERVYDDEKTSGNLGHQPGEHDNLGVSPEARDHEVAELEALLGYNPYADMGVGSPSEEGDKKPKDERTLDEREGGLSEDDKVGKGWTGKARSGTKKALGFITPPQVKIIGGLLGGGVFATILAFFTMLPLKIISIDALVDRYASSLVNEPLEIVNERLIRGYLNQVANSIDKGVCKRTTRPDCVVLGDNRAGPVGKLYQSWKQNKLENKLANKYGIILDRGADGKVHMTVGNTEIMGESLEKLRAGEIDIGDLEGREGKSKAEIRAAIRGAFDNETRWKRVFLRYQYGRLIENRYGVKRCTFACDSRDRFNSSVKDKKMAGKLFLAQRVSMVIGQNNGLMMQCVMAPGDCETSLSDSDDGSEPKSEFHKKLQTQLVDFRNTHGTAKLQDLLKNADDINKLGVTGYATRQAAVKMGSALGKDISEEAADKAIGKAVPIIGWISLALTVAEMAEKTPQVIKYTAYAMNVAEAVALYSVYRSVAAEQKSGHADATQIGSLADTLSEGSEVTAAPMYDIATSPVAKRTSTFDSIMSYAYSPVGAETGEAQLAPYKCESGDPIPKGSTGCPEEDFTNANEVINFANELVTGNFIKGKNPILDMTLDLGSFQRNILYKVNDLYGLLMGLPGVIFAKSCEIHPVCSPAMKYGTEQAMALFTWLRDKLLHHPVQYALENGARAMQMMFAANLATYSASAMANTGGAELSTEEFAAIQNRRIRQDKEDFQMKSLYSRIFDTDSRYSLATQVALESPSKQDFFSVTFAKMFENPLNKLATGANAGLSKEGSAFADVKAKKNPWGIKPIGHRLQDIPKHPDDPSYWEKNCAGRDYEKEWFDKMSQDPDTGEAIATTTEPCMLVASSVKALGGMFDNSFNDSEANTSNSTNEGEVGISGNYAFPLKTTQSAVKNHSPRWCMDEKWSTSCHHDYPAADIFADPGTEIVAMRSGTVLTVRHNSSSECSPEKGGSPTVQIKGDDGKYYFYTHFAAGSVTAKPGPIKAGDKLGVVGPRECAQGTDPHVHVQWYTSIINGDSQSMDIQAPLLKAFEGLPK